MKKSEMIERLVAYMESSMDPSMARRQAINIIEAVEEIGMLPPAIQKIVYTEEGTYQDTYAEWEPEDADD